MLMPLLLTTLVVAVSSPLLTAQDWFVRAGAQGGDGSQQQPFADPFQALEKVQAGDTVHVAEGSYFGKLGVGMWEIPFDGVQLLGGYSGDFATRDPWRHPTQLLWDKASKNRPNQGRLTSRARDVVVDGFVLDMRAQNSYQDEACTGRNDKPGDPAIELLHPAIVRNCVVVNAGQEGLIARAGSIIENNLFVNSMVSAIKLLSGPEPKSVAVVRGNSILFVWDHKSPGKGNYRGSGVYLGQGANADITGNILAHCDNNAVHSDTRLNRTSVTKNVFAMNLFCNLMTAVDGQTAAIDDKTMELLEEAGLKACEGNVVATAELPVDAAWLDRYSQRTASQPGKLVMDDWNKVRQLAGLPLLGTGYQVATGVAPPYALDQALQLVTARKDRHQAGARPIALEVKFRAAGAAVAARSYTRAELTQWNTQPDTVDGKDLEMVVAISSVANISTIPARFQQDRHAGVVLHDAEGKGVRAIGFFPRGSHAARLVDADIGHYNGNGVPDRVYLVRGTAYAVPGVPRAAFCIDSIERHEAGGGAATAAADARPVGRDWFVRAGSTGGDGSKDQPFRDPFQALEKVQAGDTVHVARGEYYGKLRAGRWRIETIHIALLGGYDDSFTERAPWTHTTRLVCPRTSRARAAATPSKATATTAG